MAWTVDDIDGADRLYRLGVRDITTNRLTQNEPQGNAFQRLLWRLKDYFAALIGRFAGFFEKVC